MKNIIQMDLLQRTYSDKKYGFVGTIYCDGFELFEEGPGYLLDLQGDPPSIYADPIIPRPYKYNQSSVDGILESKSWISTGSPCFTLVRLIPLGRGEKGFVIYGANDEPLFDIGDNSQDTLITVRDGKVDVDKCKLHTHNSKLGSLLYSVPLWHDLQGKVLLPNVLTTPAKENIREINQKRVDLGTGKITKKDFREWIIKDPDRIFYSKFGQEDESFLRYVVALEKQGLLSKNLDWMRPNERKQFHHQCRMISNKITRPFLGVSSGNDPGY